ncbi:DUF6441 family protein [Mameliella sp.]|uniref:DUF6441 family protein n=1 Tax=Mameliella sp. TaxID=1924940 RepID=UPI003BAC32D1
MSLRVTQDGDLRDITRRDFEQLERSHTAAMRRAGQFLQDAWRDEIRESGLGGRLANSVRHQTYPQGQNSMNAAALVWANSPKIILSHLEGSLIRSPNGLYLAIPAPGAGKQRFGRKMTPAAFEQKTGLKLRFVYRDSRVSFLVADGTRINKGGFVRRKGGRRRKDGILTGEQTSVVFYLVKQVKLRKKLDFLSKSDGWAARILDSVGFEE